MNSKKFLRKFGGDEGAILRNLAEGGCEEAQLILDAAKMQAQDECPDVTQLACDFKYSEYLVDRIIEKFNSQGANSFSLPKHKIEAA
jgi:hypothetical protein